MLKYIWVSDAVPIVARRPEGVLFSFPYLIFPWHHSRSKPAALPAGAVLWPKMVTFSADRTWPVAVSTLCKIFITDDSWPSGEVVKK